MADALIDDRPFFGPRPPDIEEMRRKTFVLWSEAGLTDGDRHDFATFVLGRRVRSWTEFDGGDWCRILDALTGWFAVRELRRQAGTPD